MATFKSFEELNCWKGCREVVRWVMKISNNFPKEEKFDLKDNMRRAARFSTRNIERDLGDIIMEKTSNIVEFPVALYMKL